jgi:hypothetical protein
LLSCPQINTLGCGLVQESLALQRRHPKAFFLKFEQTGGGFQPTIHTVETELARDIGKIRRERRQNPCAFKECRMSDPDAVDGSHPMTLQ